MLNFIFRFYFVMILVLYKEKIIYIHKQLIVSKIMKPKLYSLFIIFNTELAHFFQLEDR